MNMMRCQIYFAGIHHLQRCDLMKISRRKSVSPTHSRLWRRAGDTTAWSMTKWVSIDYIANNKRILIFNIRCFSSSSGGHLWHLQRGILNPTLLEPAQEERRTLQKEKQQRSLILLPYVIELGFEPIDTDS